MYKFTRVATLYTRSCSTHSKIGLLGVYDSCLDRGIHQAFFSCTGGENPKARVEGLSRPKRRNFPHPTRGIRCRLVLTKGANRSHSLAGKSATLVNAMYYDGGGCPPPPRPARTRGFAFRGVSADKPWQWAGGQGTTIARFPFVPMRWGGLSAGGFHDEFRDHRTSLIRLGRSAGLVVESLAPPSQASLSVSALGPSPGDDPLT